MSASVRAATRRATDDAVSLRPLNALRFFDQQASLLHQATTPTIESADVENDEADSDDQSLTP